MFSEPDFSQNSYYSFLGRSLQVGESLYDSPRPMTQHPEGFEIANGFCCLAERAIKEKVPMSAWNLTGWGVCACVCVCVERARARERERALSFRTSASHCHCASRGRGMHQIEGPSSETRSPSHLSYFSSQSCMTP